jgi:hypothetical protein
VTVNFDLDGISFTVSGVKHGNGVLTTFDVHSVRIQGNAAELRKKLKPDFLEEIAKAAAEEAIDPIDFPPPPHVMAVELANSPTLAEVNRRRGYSAEGGKS